LGEGGLGTKKGGARPTHWPNRLGLGVSSHFNSSTFW